MTAVASRPLQHVDPADWRRHRFGLPPERWERLSGRTFWITGAGTGYGRALATALAAAGGQVALTGRRAAKLAETCDMAAAWGIPSERFFLAPVDITDPEEVERAARRIAEALPPLFGLVNNAAVSQRPAGRWPLSDMTPGQWREQFAVNLDGAWLTTRAAAPAILAGGEGRIVFITSEAGWAFTPGVGSYNVSKAALNNLGASWAAELAARSPEADIQTNVLIPGEALTEMNRGSTVSPFTVVSMTLALLSHPPGGPNGRFFHRDGRHFAFAYAAAYDQSIL
jgi:NAD(P)-dependent dehydrogenase (short-subunit alcohol dehydrogenase family)